MPCLPPSIAAAVLSLSALFGSVDASEKPAHPPVNSDIELKLSASDLEAITAEVLRQHPLLSASPGIKAAFGYRLIPSGESASVIFYPHAESRGIKQAFQASCRRNDPGGAWSCLEVEIRRYVKLDSQDFEVRVLGSIDMDGVLAITEATRPAAASAVPDSSTVDTVLVIHPGNGGHVVSWGSSVGYAGVLVEAHLRSAGNPANPADWEAFVVPEIE